MDCKDVKELLGALADGEVSDKEREALLSHIAECETCKKEYEDIQKLKKEFSKLNVQLRGALADSVMEKIYAETYPKKKKTFFFRYIGTAAAVLVVAVTAVYIGISPKKDHAESNSAEDITVTLQASDSILNDGAVTETAPESALGKFDYQYSILDIPSSNINTKAESKEESNKDVPQAEAVEDNDEFPSSKPLKSPLDEPTVSVTPDTLKSEDATVEETPAEAESGDTTVEEPPAEAESEDISLKNFRFYNSISFNTAIIFVDSEIETVVPLLDNVESVSGDCINIDSHHSEVMDILISNSIPITKTDIPEGSTETTVFAE